MLTGSYTVAGFATVVAFALVQDLLANVIAHAATDVVGLLRATAHVRKSQDRSP